MLDLHKSKGFWALAVGCIITIAAYIWFINSPYFAPVQAWAAQNFFLFALFLVIVKIIGIIFPPLPGGLLTLGAIPIIGWWQAFLIDLIGVLIGSSIAYWLGIKYGNKILRRFFDEPIIKKVESIKIRKNREIETLVVLRFILGSVLTESMFYAAGLLKISYKNFILGVALGHLLIILPTFYFANNLLELKNLWVNALILIIAVPLFWKFRHRYFEETK